MKTYARGRRLAAARFEERAQSAEQRAAVIRKALLNLVDIATAESAATDRASSEVQGSEDGWKDDPPDRPP
jgi:hypothetical protein